jgi:hypothetical protein
MNNSSARRRRGRSRRPAIAAILAGAALLAACGGGSPTSAPGLGGPTRQDVNNYMQCMRSHGDTNFYLSRPGSPGESPDTTVGFLPYGVVLNVDFNSPQYLKANNACQHFIPGPPPPPLTAAQLRALVGAAACMRAHGIPDFPDPDVQNGQLVPDLPASIDMSSPRFIAALKTCHPF